jgi:putative transcriptional regulator
MKNRLRVFRAEHHLSQADLAERLGVARQTVHAIETGKFAPSLTLAFKIATLFGADINDVFAPDADDTLPSLLGENPVAATSVAPSRPLVFFGKPLTTQP